MSLRNTIKEPAKLSHQTPNTVAILARDAVSGRAMELLLRSVGYDARLLVTPVAHEQNGLLQGVQLLLLTPTLSVKYREDFLNSMRSIPATAKVPVLELITTLNGAQTEQEDQVLWPCRMEDLKAKIEAALSNGSASAA